MGTYDPNYYDAETGRLIDLDVLRGLFDEHLDDAYPSVEAAGTSLRMSKFLRAADRGAYDQAFNDWADSEVKDGRLSVGPPIVEWQVTLDMGGIEATDPVAAARHAAYVLARRGAEGYAWRAVYDIVGPDSTEHAVDLEIHGSGRTCLACGGVDQGEDEDGNRWVTEDGQCKLPRHGQVCGGRMEWLP